MNTSRILFAACFLVACETSKASETETSFANLEQIDPAKGIAFAGATDRGLALIVTYALRDSVGNTKAARARVVVERAGQSFMSSCGTEGFIDRNGAVAKLRCTRYPTSDLGQRLEFSIVQSNGGYAIRDIVLRGTTPVDDYMILTGQPSTTAMPVDAIALAKTAASSERLENPFLVVDDVNAALGPLLGRDVYSENERSIVAMVAFNYRIDDYFEVSGKIASATATYSAWLEELVMVETRYEARSAFVPATELARRAAAALPKAPICQDAPGTSLVDEIDAAVTPLGGPAFGLATSIQLDEAPAAARATLEAEGAKIAAYSARDDYASRVYGYYAIHASCTDATPVAYAVWGGGYGEPDYHDGFVVGVDPAGTVVSRASDGG